MMSIEIETESWCEYLDKVGVMHGNAHLWQLRQLITHRNPAMLQHLMKCDAMARVHVEHSRDKVFRQRRNRVPVCTVQIHVTLTDASQDVRWRVGRTVRKWSLPAVHKNNGICFGQYSKQLHVTFIRHF